MVFRLLIVVFCCFLGLFFSFKRVVRFYWGVEFGEIEVGFLVKFIVLEGFCWKSLGEWVGGRDLFC